MKTPRILVVEDEAVITSDLQIKLERAGYVVCGVAFTGEEALRKAEETSPDLIIMDVRLQGTMTGLEAASQIQKRREVPVVYITAYAALLVAEMADRGEKPLYVSKPFSTGELTRALDAALRR